MIAILRIRSLTFFVGFLLCSACGFFFLWSHVFAATGDVQNTTIDTQTFDATNGVTPTMVHVAGQIYAVAYEGTGGAGVVATIEIDNDGLVESSVIDTFTFDGVSADTPDIIRIDGDTYAIAYTDSSNDGIVVTVEIDVEGDISNAVVDTLEYDTVQALAPDIVYVGGQTYAIAYEGDAGDGFVVTVDIDDAGNIGAAVIDSLEFDTDTAADPSVAFIAQDIFAIAYDGVDFDGFVVTVDIDDAGNIGAAVIDSLEFDADRGQQPSIVHLVGDISAIAYVGPNADGFIASVDIDAFGNIGAAVIDSLEFDTASAFDTYAYKIENDTVAVVYSGPNTDGFVATIDIDGAGNIAASVIGSFEFETSVANNPFIVEVGEPVYAVAYSGGGNIGEISTIAIETDSAELTNIQNLVTDNARTVLVLSANATDTQISVDNGLGIDNGDSLYIDDGTNAEIVTVSGVSNNVITVSALANTYDVSSGTVTVDVLSGATHTVSFNTATTDVIEKIRYTLSAAAITDGASFASVDFANISGVTGSATPESASASVVVLDVTGGATINFNTTVSVDLQDVVNPTGANESVYSVTVETLDAGDSVIDSNEVFFQVGNELPVTAQGEASFSYTLADDGTQNNSQDSIANATVFLGNLQLDTLDNATNGRGVDGVAITVTTNSVNGYSIFLNDSTNGLVSSDFVGGGRPSGDTDFGIDDIVGSDVAWPASGTESYGYRIGNAFDSDASETDYNAFSATSESVFSNPLPVNGETTVLTIRAQASGSTPARQYRDVIEIVLVPNY